jgi:hypothetical protein
MRENILFLCSRLCFSSFDERICGSLKHFRSITVSRVTPVSFRVAAMTIPNMQVFLVALAFVSAKAAGPTQDGTLSKISNSKVVAGLLSRSGCYVPLFTLTVIADAGLIVKEFLDNIGSWKEIGNSYGVVDTSSPETKYCSYPFVNCNRSGSVTSIVLEYDASSGFKPALRGRLTANLSNLTSLQRLVIFNHSIGGPLPPEWGSPKAFPALTEM